MSTEYTDTLEKINIYVSNDTYELLNRDARAFEILKKDGYTINRNKFLNLLILGYQSAFTNKLNDDTDKIVEILSSFNMKSSDVNFAADKIMKDVMIPLQSKKRGIYSKKISLKPVKKTQSYILSIIDNLNNDTLSQYLSRMIMSYASLPAYKRETIIFSDNYHQLVDSISKHRMISFMTSWNRNHIHTVLPYCIAHSQEEMFNYLLCQEYNDNTSQYEARTYRLTRIDDIAPVYNRQEFDSVVLKHLQMMKTTAPQFSINSDEPVIVEFNDNGIKEYNRVYYGRPVPSEINIQKKGAKEYIFLCSEDQAYMYFLRLNPDNYSIVNPESLKFKLQNFTEK